MKILTIVLGLMLGLSGCAVHPLTPTPLAPLALRPVQVVQVTHTPGSTSTALPSPTNAPTDAPSATVTLEVVVAPTQAVALAAPPTERAPVLPNLVAAPVSDDVAAAEQYCLDRINAERATAGVAPLLRDETLMSIARARVADMIARGYTGHNDPLTGEPLARAMMQAAGYTSNFLGENWYGTINPPPTIVDIAMNWFMTDPPHYRNILSPNYVWVGVGIGFNGQQWLLIQNFAGTNP